MDETLLYWILGAVVLFGIPVLRSLFGLDNGASTFEARRRSGKILDDFDEEQAFVDKHSK